MLALFAGTITELLSLANLTTLSTRCPSSTSIYAILTLLEREFDPTAELCKGLFQSPCERHSTIIINLLGMVGGSSSMVIDPSILKHSFAWKWQMTKRKPQKPTITVLITCIIDDKGWGTRWWLSRTKNLDHHQPHVYPGLPNTPVLFTHAEIALLSPFQYTKSTCNSSWSPFKTWSCCSSCATSLAQSQSIGESLVLVLF